MSLGEFLPEPLRWSEGMLLSPQHFQQNDRYWHEQLALRARMLQPYGWGLWDLDLDTTTLGEGQIRVQRVEALLPDGTAVQFPAASDDATLATLDVSTHPYLAAVDGRLIVHLALPRRLRGAASERSDLRRYLPIPGGTALDENSGEDEIELDRLRACLSLLPSDRVTGGHVHIPLIEIRRNGRGFMLGEYHAPMLRLGAAAHLGEQALPARLERLLAQVLARAGSQAGDAEGRRLMSVLSVALPPLQLMLQSGEVRPFDVYLQLAALLGQMSQLGTAPLRELMTRPYRHEDLLLGFDDLLKRLERLLGRVMVGYHSLPFTRVAPGVFEVQLPEQLQANALFIEARGQERGMLQRWVNDAHIADQALQRLLQQRRLPGCGRQIVTDSQARRLPVAESGLLFALQSAMLEGDGQRRLPMLRAGGRLQICGAENGEPDGLLLYYKPAQQAAVGVGASA